jgi:hypothetical protein
MNNEASNGDHTQKINEQKNQEIPLISQEASRSEQITVLHQGQILYHVEYE